MMSKVRTKAQARIPISTRKKFKEIAMKQMSQNEEIMTETQVLIMLIESEYHEHFKRGDR